MGAQNAVLVRLARSAAGGEVEGLVQVFVDAPFARAEAALVHRHLLHAVVAQAHPAVVQRVAQAVAAAALVGIEVHRVELERAETAQTDNDLREARPQVWLLVPAVVHQLQEGLRKAGRVGPEVLVEDAVDELDLVVDILVGGAGVGAAAGVELHKNDAERVDVRLLAVLALREHLRRHVGGRAHHCHRLRRRRLDGRRTKVCHLANPVATDEEVLRLKVAVDHRARVEVRHALRRVARQLQTHVPP
mmetsp:Transcript_7869/g.33104  ORF Transcript_7869/g.33104 Transcript_7869/m.33104 type:complete len:247 (-) Transcript_7869:414-1154(-)